MADSPRGFLRKRLTYANVIATLALFLALGGTSYAVTSLPTNSVGTPQLKKNAVTGDKVKDGSLKSADFAAGTLLKGDTGATGATGATGPQGPTGANGSVAGISAEASGNSNATPMAAASTTTLVIGSFQMTATGRAFVYVTAGLDLTCSVAATPRVALYYKDNGAATWTAVEKTAIDLIKTTSGAAGSKMPVVPVTLIGLINTNLPIGYYNLEMRAGCAGGGALTINENTGGSFGSMNIGTI